MILSREISSARFPVRSTWIIKFHLLTFATLHSNEVMVNLVPVKLINSCSAVIYQTFFDENSRSIFSLRATLISLLTRIQVGFVFMKLLMAEMDRLVNLWDSLIFNFSIMTNKHLFLIVVLSTKPNLCS